MKKVRNELFKHIEASSYRTEYRWNEHLKRDIKYYRSTDGKSGEVYYSVVYSEVIILVRLLHLQRPQIVVKHLLVGIVQLIVAQIHLLHH
jgi:hypothetical protein